MLHPKKKYKELCLKNQQPAPLKLSYVENILY